MLETSSNGAKIWFYCLAYLQGFSVVDFLEAIQQSVEQEKGQQEKKEGQQDNKKEGGGAADAPMEE